MHKLLSFALSCAFSFALPAFTQDIDWKTVMEVVQNFTDALNKAGDDMKEATAVASDYLAFINDTWPDLDSHIAALSDLPAAIRHTGDAVQACIFVLSVCIIASSLVCVIPQIIHNCRRQPAYGSE